MKKRQLIYLITSVILIICILVSTIMIQIAQVKFSAADYENKLQNQAAQYLTDANQYIEQGVFDRALEKINLYFNLFPDDEKGYLMRSSIYTGSGEYEKALSDMNKVIELNSKVSDYYLQRGCLYILIDNFQNAELDFQKVIELNDNDPYAFLLIAQIYFEQKKYKEAIQTYDLYLKKNPNSSEIYAQKAYLYSLLNDNLEAAKMLQKAYDIKPTYEYATALAQSYFALKQYDKAIDFCDISLKDKADISITKLRADAYFLLEDYKNALNDYTLYLKQNSKDETVTYQQCICYLQLGQITELKAALELLLTYATNKDIIKNTNDIINYLDSL